ncbi:MAG: DUF6159 family protein [Candidatus Woesearchaeota archaeon]
MFKQSLEIFKMSWGVLVKNPFMMLFPILGALFSTVFFVALLIPAFFTLGNEVMMYVYAFILYFGFAFIATFFNVGTVYAAKQIFEKKSVGFFECLSFSIKKIHLIFLWSLLSATVGLLLLILEQLARRAKGFGPIIIGMIRSVLGMAWAIISVFVVPVMVYEGLTPIEALKRSVQVLKKTWGQSLIRHVGLGALQFIAILVGIIVTVVVVIATLGLQNIYVTLGVIGAGILYVMIVIVACNVLNTIYNTALYVYGAQQSAPEGFDSATLKQTFGEER